MSSNSYKGGLTVGGPTFDKSKLQMRRPTPDSDALASSDEDRDHVPPARPVANALYPGGRRPSSGWMQDIPMNRKFSLPSVSFAGSQPTTPSFETSVSRPPSTSFPWNTTSFTTANQGGSRFKDVVPSPTSAHHPASSSNITEIDEGINFLLTQHTSTRKAVRSQSYSVGQGDVDNPTSQLSSRNRTSVRHRPSKPSLLGEPSVGLGQLREVDSDEVESSNGSEHGIRLPLGYHEQEREREQRQTLLRQTAVENARARNRATSTGSPKPNPARKTTQFVRTPTMSSSDYAIDEHDDTHVDSPKATLTRRFSEHVAVLGRNGEPELISTATAPSWATGNVQPFGNDALSRRHSFAHVGSHTPTSFHVRTLGNTQEEDEEEISPLQTQSPEQPEHFEVSAYFTGYGPASRAINASAISAAHPDPVAPHAPPTANPYAVPTAFGRPGRRLFVVAFKCSRAEIYFIYDNTGLEVRPGDLVIVEGDRGCDLGQVTHADVSMEDAKKHKNAANQEHLRWLVMFSQYSLAGNTGDNPMLGALARAGGFPNSFNRAQLSGMGVQQDQEFKPKMIKRLAQQHEIQSLRDKEGQEAKAKRTGANKAAEHGFQMEILDAELQADHHKLTFYYYAETYVNFNALVADLFKQYKIRIWMSAVNPASVVNPNGQTQIQPPSAIGPGAIMHTRTSNAPAPVGGFGNNAYRATEQYGSGRGRRNPAQGNYDENYYAFQQQLPQYPASQNTFQVPQYGMQPMAPPMFNRYAYPNVTASGSPLGFDGGWYPPATYSASPAFNSASSAASYRGGYPATTSAESPAHGGQYMASNVGGTTYYSTAPAHNMYATTAPGFGTSAGYGNGYTAVSGAGASTAFDPAYAMANLSFGN
ncbi:hypothetical protein K458DRAFT_99099 [Lentithecium fluviatile CBS 122367]|uniref:PSP1 C-terminal domain-containing protein n=1 Tax=Lentithecium fluviatile CBS 122367 TaxID=1168545 RepID=A0A6G1JHW4_9PLEO|nr:hypothetical protein K458DRAFT_99099 [Lentithecium fluviatile CBS 122367]